MGAAEVAEGGEEGFFAELGDAEVDVHGDVE